MNSDGQKSKKRRLNDGISIPLATSDKESKRVKGCMERSEKCPWKTHGVYDKNQPKVVTELKFRSENDITKVYRVKINDDLTMKCNCGEKYGQSERGHCKHIMAIAVENFRKILLSMKHSNATKAVDDLHNYLKCLEV